MEIGGARPVALLGAVIPVGNADGAPMAVDHIRYDLLTQDAMRGVLRRVLTDAAKKDCPANIIFSSPSTPAPRRENVAAACRRNIPRK